MFHNIIRNQTKKNQNQNSCTKFYNQTQKKSEIVKIVQSKFSA